MNERVVETARGTGENMRGSFMMNHQPMQRHQWIRQCYRREPYLRHVTQSELNSRCRDLILNMLVLTEEAKVGLVPLECGGIQWLELFTHVAEEFCVRYGPYPAGFTSGFLKNEPFPDFAGELAKKAASALAATGLCANQVFIKFGKLEHMRSLYEAGQLRVQPATEYANAAHNAAIRDDELTFNVALSLTRDTLLKIVRNPNDVPVDEKGQRLNVHFRHPNNFWTYCVSSSVEPRLFVDFNARACVIIRDRQEFTRRLRSAGARCLSARSAVDAPAVYLDPHRAPSTAALDLRLVKHFKYRYQHEYRFAWDPIGQSNSLPPVDIEVGSLCGIAELICIE
jgi:hypothetical protein